MSTKKTMPQDQAGANGGLSDKAPGAPMEKAKHEEPDGDEGGDEGEDEGDEEETDKAKKSVDQDDLIKALGLLEDVASGNSGTPDRRAELAKSFADGTLSDEQRQEFLSLLQPEEQPEPEDFAKSFAEDQQLAADYDVSAFLETIGTKVATALQGVTDQLQKSRENQGQFNSALAKSMVGMGRLVVEQGSLIKSQQQVIGELGRRLGHVEQQPMPRKSAPSTTTAQTLKKSFEGGGQGDSLSRQDILKGLNSLFLKSQANGYRSKSGEDLALAITKYEGPTMEISKSLLREVAEELGKSVNI